MRRWKVWDLARRSASGFAAGWEALPAPARRRFWRRLAGGFLLAIAFTVALVLAGRSAGRAGWLAGEAALIRRFADQGPVSLSLAVFLDAAGNTLLLWAVVLLGAAVAAYRRRPLRALGLLLGHTGNFLLVGLAWLLWPRERPEVVLGGTASPSGWFMAYPSAHLEQTVFVWGLLCLWWARGTRSRAERTVAGLVFAGGALAVAVARLRLGAHWPSDLAAGALLGAFWAAAVDRATATGSSS